MDKLSIQNEMAQFDQKNRDFYDDLDEQEKKKFSTYIMLKWGANVSGNKDLQSYYLVATNECVNKNFFDLGRHPKLQWLCCTTVSPSMGKQYHYWLKVKSKEGNNKVGKFLAKLFPTAKTDELDMLEKLNDVASLKKLARDMGMDDKDIKKELG